jgi:hypothetical protein
MNNLKNILASRAKKRHAILSRAKTIAAYAFVLILASASLASAQGGLAAGQKGIEDATSAIADYFDPATKLIYAIGAVAGLIGGFKVFSKWNSGDQDAQKSAMAWFGSCIFLLVVATALRAFFL